MMREPSGGEKTHFRDRADRGMQLSAFVAVDPARLINRFGPITSQKNGVSALGLQGWVLGVGSGVMTAGVGPRA
jgi:hypothetical protein